MSITIRLGKELEEFIIKESKNEGMSKSGFIRKCIAYYYQQKISKKTPYEIGKNYFGRFDSSNPDLAKDRKKIIREKIHAKKSDH